MKRKAGTLIGYLPSRRTRTIAWGSVEFYTPCPASLLPKPSVFTLG